MTARHTSIIPTDYKRIVLLNPTRYLGNLMIAGGIIQHFLQHCKKNNIHFLLVVDAAYQGLLKNSFPANTLLFYPRKQIKQATFLKKLSSYLNCLFAIRRFNADIAFNIEEDSVSHRLTQLSGAKFKLGSNIKRNKYGYNHVLDINYSKRDATHKHRWYGFAEVFSTLGLQSIPPSYLNLSITKLSVTLREKLNQLGVELQTPLVVIHASAAKDYKKWPSANFAALISLLNEHGYKTLLIGVGAEDQQTNSSIIEHLKTDFSEVTCTDLCNQLSLFELASLFTQVQAIVGNDSGPFHLAAAMDVKGCVIFGPTDVGLWRPLSLNSIVLKSNEACAPECTKTGCIYENRCLKSIKPAQVLEKLQGLL
ncbi:MAG: glycosyltransferase family 9 protein [Pseudohongiellaceae bacterium]